MSGGGADVGDSRKWTYVSQEVGVHTAVCSLLRNVFYWCVYVTATQEHPVTGEPYYFLHPCHTADRMTLLTSELDPTELSKRPVVYLLAWWSVMAPLFRVRVNPLAWSSWLKLNK